MLTRLDPLREMMTMRSAIDRMFDSSLVGAPRWDAVASWDLALDVTETDDEYVVKASIPGISPDDLEISYKNNTLTIKGEMKEEKEVEDAKYHMRERRYGSFGRTISLPTAIDADAIEAGYDQGVLTLHLPKTEEAKPKKIVVKTPAMIEGKMKDK